MTSKYEFKSYSNLIAAILHQSFLDSFSLNREDDPIGANKFINSNNDLFVYYCEFIEMDASLLASKMRHLIGNNKKNIKFLNEKDIDK